MRNEHSLPMVAAIIYAGDGIPDGQTGLILVPPGGEYPGDIPVTLVQMPTVDMMGLRLGALVTPHWVRDRQPAQEVAQPLAAPITESS